MDKEREKEPYKPFSGSIFGSKGSLISLIFLIIVGIFVVFFRKKNPSETEKTRQNYIIRQDSMIIDTTETGKDKHEN